MPSGTGRPAASACVTAALAAEPAGEEAPRWALAVAAPPWPHLDAPRPGVVDAGPESAASCGRTAKINSD